MDKYSLNIWVKISASAIQHLGEKKVLGAFPTDQAKTFAYSCSYTIHTSYKNGMLGQKGGGCQNAQKQIYYKQIIQEDPWALDRSPESLSRGEDVYHKIILLPSADSFKKGCCQLQAKACARITG